MGMSRAIVLFTCDLRVHDHPALAAAARESEQVIPLFVLDERLLGRRCASPNRIAFLRDCLRDLDEALRERGAQLVLRRGDVVRETLSLAERLRRTRCTSAPTPRPMPPSATSGSPAPARERAWSCASTPGRRCSRRARSAPRAAITTACSRPTGARGARARRRPRRRLRGGCARRLACPRCDCPRLTALSGAARASPSSSARGGERAAARASDALARRRPRRLRRAPRRPRRRARPRGSAPTCTSAASRRARCSSARAAARGAEDFVRQLCWRDFHRQVLAARPDMPHADYRPRGDRWRRSRSATLEAWREGLTGLPDRRRGDAPARRRGLHAQPRAADRRLVPDQDALSRLARGRRALRLGCCRTPTWPTTSATGSGSPAPATTRARTACSTRCARRSASIRDGDYVRRHVPELAGVAGRAVHEPWRLAAAERRVLRYPAPIVDLEAAARELRRGARHERAGRDPRRDDPPRPAAEAGGHRRQRREARALLDAEPALVNGEPESRRGRQLHPGDTSTRAATRCA